MKNQEINLLHEVTAENRPGERLLYARKSLNLTREDIAAQLNLSLDAVDALENDDYSRLPGETFTRGYLRAYARLVGVDENDVTPVEEIPTERILSDDRMRQTRSQIMRSHSMHKKNASRGKYFVLVLLAIIAISWGFAGVPWSKFVSNIPYLSDIVAVDNESAPAETTNEPEVKININRTSQ